MRTRSTSRRLAVATAALVLTALTGCSALDMLTGAPGPMSSTASLMTTAQAGEYYLDVICPNNAAATLYGDTYDALIAAGGGDSAPTIAAAAAMRDSTQVTAERLIDPTVIWPETVAEDVVIVSKSLSTALREYTAAAAATSYEELIDVPATIETEAVAAAAPRIRATLGLPADYDASCIGH